jgi:hypothetical protein
MGWEFAKRREPEYMLPGAVEKCRYDRRIHETLFALTLEG